MFEKMTFIFFTKILTHHYNGNHEFITSGHINKVTLCCKFLYAFMFQLKKIENYKTFEITTQYNFNALKLHVIY